MPPFEALVGGGVLGMVLLVIAPTILLGLAVPYVILRVRESGGQSDPQIGVKAALHFFISVGMILMLFGLTMIFMDLFTRSDRQKLQRFPVDEVLDAMPIRLGLGFLVSGGIVTLIHGLLLLATNDSALRTARRAFTGTRFAIHGIVLAVTLTALFCHWFQKNSKSEDLKTYLAILLVWLPSWIVHLALLIAGTPRQIDRPRMAGYDDR